MKQSSDNKSISLRDNLGKILELLEAATCAEEIGHGSMQDAFQGDLQAIIEKGAEGVNDAIQVINFLSVKSAGIRGEIAEMQRQIASLEATVRKNDRYTEYLEGLAGKTMAITGSTKLYGLHGRHFAFRTHTAVRITALDQLTDTFKRVTTSIEPDKVAISKELKAGRPVPGAEIEYRKSVVVK